MSIIFDSFCPVAFFCNYSLLSYFALQSMFFDIFFWLFGHASVASSKIGSGMSLIQLFQGTQWPPSGHRFPVPCAFQDTLLLEFLQLDALRSETIAKSFRALLHRFILGKGMVNVNVLRTAQWRSKATVEPSTWCRNCPDLDQEGCRSRAALR